MFRFRVKGSVFRCATLCSLIKSIRKNKEKHPAWTIHFSTLTNTGMRVAKEKLTDADNIFFVPLDFKHVVRKYFNILRPRVFVLAESELWPNLLREANRQTKGVLLINGRISSRSFKRYSRFKFVAKKILKNIDLFLVQTEKDKENLCCPFLSIFLGMVMGNTRYDFSCVHCRHHKNYLQQHPSSSLCRRAYKQGIKAMTFI